MEFSRPEYWVAFPFSRGFSQPRDRTPVSCIAGGKDQLCFRSHISKLGCGPDLYYRCYAFSHCIPCCILLSSRQVSPSVQFSSVQSLSCVRLFATPWIAACQASLSITSSWSSFRLTSSSQWCHPAISSPVIPFSSCPQSLPASESFPRSQLFAWGGTLLKCGSKPFNILMTEKEIHHHHKVNNRQPLRVRAMLFWNIL